MQIEPAATPDPNTPEPKKRTRKPLPPASPAARYAAREQLEALTGIPTATWATWASRPPDCGPPPMVKLGRRALYPLPELFEWLARRVRERT